ncbi:MAG: hypothetical protein HY678_11660 [Chloroflexi bacterium]|nr:hypothetical protein [Chloroflexota bacterium]
MGKVIQVPIEAELLSELNSVSKRQKRPRAEIIREACRRYLQIWREEQLDRAYVRGYRKRPEDGDLAASQVAVAGRVLPRENW